MFSLQFPLVQLHVFVQTDGHALLPTAAGKRNGEVYHLARRSCHFTALFALCRIASHSITALPEFILMPPRSLRVAPRRSVASQNGMRDPRGCRADAPGEDGDADAGPPRGREARTPEPGSRLVSSPRALCGRHTLFPSAMPPGNEAPLAVAVPSPKTASSRASLRVHTCGSPRNQIYYNIQTHII